MTENYPIDNAINDIFIDRKKEEEEKEEEKERLKCFRYRGNEKNIAGTFLPVPRRAKRLRENRG